MSDGIHFQDAPTLLDLPDRAGDEPGFAHASRTVRESTPASPILGDLLEWLPRLGSVLWLDRRSSNAERRPVNRAGSTVLLDHPAIGMLSTSKSLDAHHAVTPQGPREWLSFQAASGAINAKLFLLPDSDVLAWDQMCSAMKLAPDEPVRQEPPTHSAFLRRALARLGHRWQARLLEFRFLQRPWLSVLDAQPPLRISLLGIDIARSIVHDENAEWLSPLHMPRDPLP